MKSDRTDSSSDLEGARELSRRLAGGRTRGPTPSPATDYVPFTFSSVIRRSAETGARAQAAASPAAQPDAPKPESATTWDEFLARSLPAAQADAAFLMDGQGLLVASCGPTPASDLEGIGARLTAALEHGRRTQLEEGRDPAAVVELGSSWLTGFAVALRDGSTLTMGVIGPVPLHAEVRARLSGALWRWRASLEPPPARHAP